MCELYQISFVEDLSTFTQTDPKCNKFPAFLNRNNNLMKYTKNIIRIPYFIFA